MQNMAVTGLFIAISNSSVISGLHCTSKKRGRILLHWGHRGHFDTCQDSVTDPKAQGKEQESASQKEGDL